MPRPTHNGASYLPALDGLRALAVGFVVLYHLHVPGLDSGLLGVGVFFTLSGFLITSILLSTRERTGGFALTKFWLARARRLLPAVLLVLATALLATWITDPDTLVKRGKQALSALFYVNNWYNIGTADSYFDRFGGPGPFDHLWSLSIEEQFYLLWPLLLAGLLLVLRKRLWVTCAVLALAAGSFLLLNDLAAPSLDNSRAYEGTDTRAGGLLLGAALAVWWPARARTVGHAARCWIDVFALAGLGAIAFLIATTPDGDISLYRSGILILTVATMAVLVATVVPETLVASILGIAPLRWIGERSYGIYLWHMPVIAFLPGTLRSERPVATAAITIGVTIAFAAVSWRYVEDPIRRLGFKRAFTTARAPADTIRNHTLTAVIAFLTRIVTLLDALRARTPTPDAPATGPTGTPPAPMTVPPVLTEPREITSPNGVTAPVFQLPVPDVAALRAAARAYREPAHPDVDLTDLTEAATGRRLPPLTTRRARWVMEPVPPPGTGETAPAPSSPAPAPPSPAPPSPEPAPATPPADRDHARPVRIPAAPRPAAERGPRGAAPPAARPAGRRRGGGGGRRRPHIG
ncbi:MAG: acyltransferase, partial [Gordonia sp. (in: high G+C Gram-positive bacteria)]